MASAALADSDAADSDTELIGLIEAEDAPERRFVKARLEDGRFLLCHVHGFTTKYWVLTEQEVRDIFDKPAPESSSNVYEHMTSTGDDHVLGEAFELNKAEMLHELFAAIDTDGDGQLSFTEFTAAVDSNVAIRKLLAGDGTTLLRLLRFTAVTAATADAAVTADTAVTAVIAVTAVTAVTGSWQATAPRRGTTPRKPPVSTAISPSRSSFPFLASSRPHSLPIRSSPRRHIAPSPHRRGW